MPDSMNKFRSYIYRKIEYSMHIIVQKLPAKGTSYKFSKLNARFVPCISHAKYEYAYCHLIKFQLSFAKIHKFAV